MTREEEMTAFLDGRLSKLGRAMTREEEMRSFLAGRLSEMILHGTPCDCTLHDIGLNCQRALSRNDLDREACDLVRTAFRSGVRAADITQAFMLAVERHRALEVSP